MDIKDIKIEKMREKMNRQELKDKICVVLDEDDCFLGDVLKEEELAGNDLCITVQLHRMSYNDETDEADADLIWEGITS